MKEQKKIEEQLRESERRFRTLTELSPAGIYLTDPDGNCTYVNSCWQEMSGLSTSEALGDGWIKAIHPDDRSRVFEAWQAMINTGIDFALKYRFITPEGNITWVFGVAKMIQTANGKCDGYVGINTNINTLKQAEIELQLTFTELENLVKERTQDLHHSYKRLQKELKIRKETEQALLKSEDQLEKEKTNLEEINIALRVLLKKREEEKHKLEEQMLMNATKLITPHIEKLKKEPLSPGQKANISLIETNLQKLTSPFLRNISALSLRLSPMEIKVAQFVKEGASSKEIAETLNLSSATINIHRKNIRKKIGIKGKKSNLRSMLMALDD